MTLVKLLNNFNLRKDKLASLAKQDQETSVSKHIPFSHFITPSVFVTKNDELGAIIKAEGITFEVTDNNQLNKFASNIAFMTQGLGDEFAVYFTTHRHKANASLTGSFPHGFAKEFAESYASKFESKELFLNDIYISLILKAGSTKVKKGLNFFQKLKIRQIKNDQCLWQEEQLKRLNYQLISTLNLLSEYSPTLLTYEIDDDNQYSQVLSFLSIMVNGESKKLMYPLEDIASYVPYKRLFFGHTAIHYQGLHQKNDRSDGDGKNNKNNKNIKKDKRDRSDKFAALLSIKKYYPKQVPGLLNGLLSLPFEYIVTHSYLGIDKSQALALIRRQEARLIAVGDEAKSQVAEMDIAADDLASDRISFGYHHNTLLIFANSLSDLEDKVAQAEKIYADVGIVVIRETLNLESAFWAQIPGNFSYIRRSALISSNNLSCFCSLHNYYSGYKDKNYLGSALMLAETRSRTPFYLNLHERASGRTDDLSKGHTTMIGNSGGGKTVFMMTINTLFQKYGIRSFIFDRNRGCDIYVRAMGGQYFLLDPSENTGWNPCQLPDTPDNRDFLRSFLKALIVRTDVTLTAQDENQISEVVDRNFSLSFEKRTLSNITSFFRHDFMGLDNLSRWIRLPDRTGRSGELAYLFDNPVDTLNLNIDTMGFDMTYLLGSDADKNKDILAPIMMYLFHRIKLCMNGRLTGVFLDEGWQFLNHPYWITKLDEYYVTWRKNNGFLFFATQLPDKVAKSALASVLIQGTATNIFLPNPNAEEQDYIESFKLTKAEFEFIKNTRLESRYFLIKQGHEAAVIRLDLSNLQRYLAVLSGTKSTVEICDELRVKYGDATLAWLPAFYEKIAT